jgi:antitoxin (DNA-binding transcriptional repressor) of toxin-antitoxin stability system
MKTIDYDEAVETFPSLLEEVESGEQIGISSSAGTGTVAVLVPYQIWKPSHPRVLGTLAKKMSVKFADDWYMTDEELVNP